MKSIVLCGGGTAGHIMPNIALLPEFKKHYDNIYYLGGQNSLEERIASSYNIPFYHTPVIKFRRKKILNNIKIPFVMLGGIKKAKSILRQLNPCVVFAKGGYASLPAAYAAKSLGIPVICHESDMTLGLANRLISRFSTVTMTSYPDTVARGNVITVGTPIRDSIARGNKDRIIRKYNLNSKPIILVMGGSMGSKAINRVVLQAAEELLQTFNIIHISGSENNDFRAEGYINVAFASNIEDYFAAAHIVISRAGATACAELASIKKKTLLIPLPKGTSRGDQVLNAKAYQKAGAAKVLLQDDLNKDSLIMAINTLNNETSPNVNIKTASNAEIVNIIVKYSRR